MTVTGSTPAAVTTAMADLVDEQQRVAGLLDLAGARGSWEVRLPLDDRTRLARSGHFPQYAGELDWTPREVAGHLRDSARIFTDRIHRIRTEEEPLLADFVTDAPERLAEYRETPPERLVTDLRTAQSGLLRAVAGVRRADLARAGVHEVDGRITVADLLAFLPDHQRDHAEQLSALMPR